VLARLVRRLCGANARRCLTRMGTALRADDDADADVGAGVHRLARRAPDDDDGVVHASRAAPRDDDDDARGEEEDDDDARGEEEDAGE